jgi:hypothetical protein
MYCVVASGFLDRQYSDVFVCNHAHYSNASSDVLEKLIVTQLVNTFLSFHVLPHLQGSAIGQQIHFQFHIADSFWRSW